ncbi:MAG TPA: hypothetical protein PKM59_04490 [Thermodesulfobacteriota bacterium]|nr:hypothetical protein [Deltaproteobacteria bacterium]HNR12557.1 hypothetical protein [Thermodesulfobacteriota bacterium]HNU71708.1 hypothetical protein [Thermodesulfobacteriota bacterium]
MRDREKTKKRLVSEVEHQRKRIAELETLVLERTACLIAALERLLAHEEENRTSEMPLDWVGEELLQMQKEERRRMLQRLAACAETEMGKRCN